MKKRNIILGILLPLVCCTSCGEAFSWEKYANDSVSLSLKSKKLERFRINVDYDSMNSHKNALDQVIERGGSLSRFNSCVNTIYSDYADTANAFNIYELDYYADPTDDNYEKYLNQYNYYVDFNRYILGLDEKIAKSSEVIKKSWFGDITEDEITQQVEENTTRSEAAVIQAELTRISNQMEVTYNDYVKRKINKEQYLNLSYDAYFEYINKANQIRDLYKLDNYLDLIYSGTYYRDYDINDALEFVNYTKQYIAPIYADTMDLTKPDDLDEDFFNKFSTYNFCNRTTKAYKLYENFAKAMGGSYLNEYNYLWRDGYYRFADSPNSLGTAYVTEIFDSLFNVKNCILYFSSSYQTIDDIIHEFGHYYATMRNKNNSYVAYDIKETHSQGDEFTFFNYLVSNYQDDPHFKELEFFADSAAYENLFYIVNEACITEIEAFAFGTEDLTKELLREGVEEIIASYNGAAHDVYWACPCVASCGYYVSYATSALESMQFYAMDFDDAKEAYLNLVEHPNRTSIVSAFTNAGLLSPFEEETFIELSQMFIEIRDKYKEN